MRSTRLLLWIIIVVIGLLLVAFFLQRDSSITHQQYAENRLQPKASSQEVQNKLSACGALPNGTTTTVRNATRMYIAIPKDIYPNVNVALASNGATATWVADSGEYGAAATSTVKENCWSYYFEFDGQGTVDLISKSGVTGVSDYILHFIVTS